MIIENGTISLLEAQGEPVFDEYGQPDAIEKEWSEDMPCCIQHIRQNRRSEYEDGTATESQYKVLVTPQQVTAKRVRLRKGGEELGEFKVISVALLEAVQATEITVSNIKA